MGYDPFNLQHAALIAAQSYANYTASRPALEHIASADCWCRPVPDAEVEGVFIHRDAPGGAPTDLIAARG